MDDYYIKKDGLDIGPMPLEDLKKNVIYPYTLIWNETWENWQKAEDVPELITSLRKPPPKIIQGEQTFSNKEPIKKEEKPNIVDRFYGYIGVLIDKRFENNPQEETLSSLDGFLYKSREKFKELNSNQKETVLFFITSTLVFLGSLVILKSLGASYLITAIWITFIALNQFDVIYNILKKITDVIVLFTLGFLPDFLKQKIAAAIKNLSILIVAIFFGKYIAPLYVLYSIFKSFVEPSENNGYENVES